MGETKSTRNFPVRDEDLDRGKKKKVFVICNNVYKSMINNAGKVRKATTGMNSQ